jgi:hypothetical protein
MTRFRFTIGSLILIVAVVAVALAAIRNASRPWAGAILSITFFALICSFLGIVLGRGMRRVYWSGFAVLGWSYILLMYVPWLGEHIGHFLLAPNLFEYLEEVVAAGAQSEASGMGGMGGGALGGLQSIPVELIGAFATGGAFESGSPFISIYASDLQRIGMAMEALLWAFLGGWVACYFASGRGEERQSRPSAPSGTAGAGEQRSDG